MLVCPFPLGRLNPKLWIMIQVDFTERTVAVVTHIAIAM